MSHTMIWKTLHSHIFPPLAHHYTCPQGTKQCGGSTGIVCCDNSANVDSPCLANVTQMFKNIKKAMEFRVCPIYIHIFTIHDTFCHIGGRKWCRDWKHKTTFLQINQLDNFDEKFKRLGRVSSLFVCSSVCLLVYMYQRRKIWQVCVLLCQVPCQVLGIICVANLDLRKVVKLLNGKSSKNATFNNATEMLAKALGDPSSCCN